MLWQECVEPDVFYATVSPMDKHGWFSFGVSASVARAAMSRAKKVFLEVNRFMPRTHGTVDFVRGTGISEGGKSFLAIHSTTKNDTISKIKPVLTEGAHVTCSKNEIDYVATEYGVTRLKGKTASQRAKALIAIAHPKFREKLTHAAQKLHLIV